MKKFLTVIMLFFLLILFYQNVNYSCNALAISVNLNKDCINYILKIDDKEYRFKDNDFNLNLSKIQKKFYHKFSEFDKIKNLGLSDEETINYLYPEVKYIFEKISNQNNLKESDDFVFVEKNCCKLYFQNGKKGKFINKQEFYNLLKNELKENKKEIKFNLKTNEYKNKIKVEELFKEKSCFSTNFEKSSNERKNNIRIALSAFDGIVLDVGECLSFNDTTGIRNEKNGYSKAKIISNGTFIEGYGGGVCQVSTTLYNACLLAGLEIIEANSHSLPVSYIEPSFDAMVNSGSSDLIIKNNTDGKIIITTSSKNDICKVKIFGLKNKYKITRKSEKISIIRASGDTIETDYKKYGDINLEVGEEKRLSYAKDGFISRGYLTFYDDKGNKQKEEMIRENIYNPTAGIILKREN